MVVDKNIFSNIQKNRFFKKPENVKKNNFGDFSLICKNEGRIELIHVSILKKKIKTLIKKKKSEVDATREKIWYFGTPNFFIQKKSKNSRMGKGKGLIERKVIRIKKNFKLFEFKGVSPIKLKKLLIFINKLMSVKFFLYKNYNNNFCL